MSASVPVNVFCLLSVPHWIRAAGVSAGLPAPVKRFTMPGKFFTPMYMANVPAPTASRSQSTSLSAFLGSSWPVIRTTVEAMPLWVRGIPAYAAAASAEVIPGTTAKGISCRASSKASSPPRPNTKGSPPLRRTTIFPSSARATSRALISSWGRECLPAILPTQIRSQLSGQLSSRTGLAK